MRNDVIAYLEQKQVKVTTIFNYEEGIINAEVEKLPKSGKVNILFDDNVCEISNITGGEVFGVDDGIAIVIATVGDVIKFDLKVKKNYLVKSIYKFINRFITREALLHELNLFKASEAGASYASKVGDLINLINEKEVDVVAANYLKDSEINNELLNELSDKELMLLIVQSRSATNLIRVDQERFHRLYFEAAKSNYALENVWRLATNYSGKGLDFSELEEYFVSCKDVWYIVEYLKNVGQANIDNIIDLVKKSDDQEFINRFKTDESIVKLLGNKLGEL